MTLVATPMSEKTADEYCRYGSVKLDAEVIPLAKAAALVSGKTFGEWLSDLANEAQAKTLKRAAIKRKPPKPREPRSTGD